MRQTISAPHDSLPARAETPMRRSAVAAGMPAATFLLLILAIGLTVLAGRPAAARADDNVVANGDLTQGAPGKTPEHWRTEAWISTPDASSYKWSNGEIEVDSTKANDARWVQDLHVIPGWYHFTADIRGENVGEGNTGASIGLMEDGIISQE